MNESKFTPGPWTIGVDNVVYDEKHRDPVCDASFRSDEVSLANANLIAAAPDMIKALKAARDLWGDYLPAGSSNAMKAMKLVNAAIAKATA